MAPSTESDLKSILMAHLTDGLNRSLNALEEAGALNLAEMRSEYKGAGSRYYDIVTTILESTSERAATQILAAFPQSQTPSDDLPGGAT